MTSTSPPLTDAELIRQAQAGGHEAFTVLIGQRIDALFAVAHRIMRDYAVAEDATQRALVDAWRKLPQLRDPNKFDGWLYRMLVNSCKNEWQRTERWNRKLRLVNPEPPVVPDSGRTLADRDALERAFRRLSPEQRAVVVMRHYLGWSPGDIAAELGIPVGTVSSRLHYAMTTLRGALVEDAAIAAESARELYR